MLIIHHRNFMKKRNLLFTSYSRLFTTIAIGIQRTWTSKLTCGERFPYLAVIDVTSILFYSIESRMASLFVSWCLTLTQVESHIDSLVVLLLQSVGGSSVYNLQCSRYNGSFCCEVDLLVIMSFIWIVFNLGTGSLIVSLTTSNESMVIAVRWVTNLKVHLVSFWGVNLSVDLRSSFESNPN